MVFLELSEINQLREAQSILLIYILFIFLSDFVLFIDKVVRFEFAFGFFLFFAHDFCILFPPFGKIAFFSSWGVGFCPFLRPFSINISLVSSGHSNKIITSQNKMHTLPKKKNLSVTSRTKNKLPNIHLVPGDLSISQTSSQKNPKTVRSISSNLESTPTSMLKPRSKKVKLEAYTRQFEQILIEFVPDKYYLNPSSQISFMAFPVIPNIKIPSSFPSINLT